MQVKKFEARTMKEALEMVKVQLGPDAIILSAKDNSKKYGLVGESSFEITAAVSEETLHKKKYTESKMHSTDLGRFQSSPARVQKEIINKFVEKHNKVLVPKPITTQRYADISEDQNRAEERIRTAAQRAFDAFDTQINKDKAQKAVLAQKAQQAQLNQRNVQNTQVGDHSYAMIQDDARPEYEIAALKNEINSLRQILSDFQNASSSSKTTQHPGNDVGINYELSSFYQSLIQEGITESVAAELILDIQAQLPPIKLKNKSLLEGLLAKKILDTVQLSQTNDRKFHFFVGPSGSGKTSTMIKMASQLLVRDHKRVAILTCDNQKVGAIEQLRIYTQILNVPFAVIRNQSDWKEVLKFISNIDYILVDCPGMSLKGNNDHEFFDRLKISDLPSKVIHLVVSARSKYQDLEEIFNRYSVLNFSDLIVNHIDESAQNGHLYSFVKNFQVPLHSFGIGQRIPEDFEYATKERLVDLIFHITKKNNYNQEAPL